jgi:hypothetical protein
MRKPFDTPREENLRPPLERWRAICHEHAQTAWRQEHCTSNPRQERPKSFESDLWNRVRPNHRPSQALRDVTWCQADSIHRPDPCRLSLCFDYEYGYSHATSWN